MADFKTRIGTITSAFQTESLSGQRDIGGSVVTDSGRIVLAAGPSDTWQEKHFKVVVSDDNGETFAEKFVMSPHYDVTYHTTGMLYDKKHDVLMALFGETKGFELFNTRNDSSTGVRTFSPDNFGHSKLMMARSIDNGEHWELFTLYDYGENNKGHIFCSGIGGCGVHIGDDIFVPQILGSANEAMNASRLEIYLSRIRNLSRENDEDSFEFENEFRVLSSNSDRDIRYSDETVYIRKLDKTGFVSFHRAAPGMPYRREYDNDHRPTSDFMRVGARGFEPCDYDHGVNGPLVIAFNVIRMLDGNLMLASRFYGTEHHKAGNIFMTSRDEGLTWDYRDDQIPCGLDPLQFYPHGAGGNPSMSYMPDASLIHTTSCGWTLPPLANGGSFVTGFRGFNIRIDERALDNGTVSIDALDLVGTEPVYIANVVIKDKKAMDFGTSPFDLYALTDYSPDRREIKIDYKITGPSPSMTLRITLANRVNSYRPSFEPVIMLKG